MAGNRIDIFLADVVIVPGVTPASAPPCTFPTTAAPVLRPIRKCGRTPCLRFRLDRRSLGRRY